jgi:hypothetical protein
MVFCPLLGHPHLPFDLKRPLTAIPYGSCTLSISSDKHRTIPLSWGLVPTGLSNEFGVFENAGYFPLRFIDDGEVIGGIATVNPNAKLTLQVEFHEPAEVQGQPVLDTVNRMHPRTRTAATGDPKRPENRGRWNRGCAA